VAKELVEVSVLDADEAAFPDKLVEFVLHVHAGRRQGGEHPRLPAVRPCAASR
jgi:hypothetical protein